MATSPGTVESFAVALGRALAPLKDRLAAGQVIDLFAELGVNFPAGLAAQANFANALQNSITGATQLPPLIAQLITAIEAQDEGQILAAAPGLINSIKSLIQGLDGVATELPAAATAVGFNAADAAAFAGQLVEKLLGYLFIRFLEGYAPFTLNFLSLAGLVDRMPVAADGLTKPAHTARLLRFDRIGDWFSSPANVLSTVYGWGGAGFDGKELLRRIQDLFQTAGLSAHLNDTAVPATLELFAMTLKPKTDVNPAGLRIDVREDLPFTGTIAIPLSDNGLSVQIVLATDIKAGMGVAITPPADVALIPPSGSAQGALTLQVVKTATGSDSFAVLGTTGGSGLFAKTAQLSVGTQVQWDSASNSALGDFLVEFDLEQGQIVVDLGGADSFIGSIMPSGGIRFGFDLGAGWSAHRGVFFTGGASLEINLPLHVSLGPVNLETLHLLLRLQGGDIALDTTLTADASLGPLAISVDRIGLTSDLKFQRGNLGPADLSFAFKPPSGLGIQIDAGVLAGGGYIALDPDKGEYAGVLDAALLDVVQIKIIGVLDTVMPDGSKGFSFLLIITFDFPPVQLSFGFTLNGVGGLVGINRTLSTDALHAGFRAHALNSVLFPPDPVKNAPQVISNIRNFFPPADTRFLFGPMVEIGWGTPTLITLSIGVFLEVPDPVRILILGLIDAGLPTTDAALIELHIDIIGLVDFEAKTLSIDGSMYDSHVLIYSMAGDLALRLSWGDDPSFLFSLGGFNPHFNTAGLDVPPMHRCSVSIGDGDNPRISANNYFAITSNSVQFGANVEAYAAAGGFSIHGYLGFDLIVIFSPFSFEFDFSAGFDVAYDGHTLLGLKVSGTFAGPRPWHLHGDAEIDILFFSVSVSVDLTWGDSTPVILPQQPVLPDLLPALQDPRNWSAALPDGTTQTVSFAARNPADNTLLVHPLGTLSVREKIVPLDLPITRYGSATPADGNLFAISDVQINNQEEGKQSFQDYFAAAQFLTLSDADKLSRPSFELYDAGAQIGAAGIVAGADSPRTVTYEERYIDEPLSFSRFSRVYSMSASIHDSLVAKGAGFRSPLKNTGMTKYRAGAAGPAVTTDDPGYVVAGVDDLAVRSDIVSSAGSTYFKARASLDTYLVSHPEEAVNLQILPTHEVAA